MADQEWELSKENVAPVARGRNVGVLNKALKSSKDQTESQRLTHESSVRDAIAGAGPHKDDPLEAWTRYIKWLVENYPAGSDALVRAVEEACRMYARSERYRDDIRFLRLWVRYIDMRQDKLDVFTYMNRKRIGESWALFYEAWAITLEVARQYDDAERVYRMGRETQAKPLERLAQREREYYNRMAARRRRDDKKKRDAEKKKMQESLRDTARKERESSRVGPSLANSVLSVPDAESPCASVESSSQRIRPALGKISERQARTGRRPLMRENKDRATPVRKPLGHAQDQKSTHSTNGQKFQIYVDASSPSHKPALERSSEGQQSDVVPFPTLAKRDEVGKEDEGRLPSRWAGETLPQADGAKKRMKARALESNSVPSFEVYQDLNVELSVGDPVVQAAIEDVRDKVQTRLTTSKAPEKEESSFRTVKQETRPHSPKPTAQGKMTVRAASPTINTKLAMKEVDDMFNSSLPEERDRADLFGARLAGNHDSGEAIPANQTTETQHSGRDIVHELDDGKENLLGLRVRSIADEGPSGNPMLEKRVLQPIRELEGPFIRREHDDEPDVIPVSVATDVDNSASRRLTESSPPATFAGSQEYDIGEFLAAWCFSDPHFRLMEEPDPEPEADGMFDLHCKQGLVSFNVDKYLWRGYRGQSQVVLAEDLNNSFNLMDMNQAVESDEDDLPVVAVKVSQTSNAWEYYIYKTIHKRLSTPSKSLPQAVAFCEGNPRSFLILDSIATCSLEEAIKLYAEGVMREMLCMFFTASLLRTLESLHETEVIHSDVTLSNVLFRNDPSVSLTSHTYSAGGKGGWSGKGILLVDFNNAIDAKHLQLRTGEIESVARHAAIIGNSFLNEDYRFGKAESWAYNVDCYAASVCVAKMLGLSLASLDLQARALRFASTWGSFFTGMRGLTALSTNLDTIEAMRKSREEMEVILETDKMLAISLMKLSNMVMEADNGDTTTGF